MNLRDFIRTVPDTPRPGILFYDVTPLLADGAAFALAVRQMYEAVLPLAPTKIIAPEARGFLFAAPLAYLLAWDSFPSANRASCPAPVIQSPMIWNTARTGSVCTRTPFRRKIASLS